MMMLAAGCLPAARCGDGDRITAADLAAAEPGFSALPPDTPHGLCAGCRARPAFSAWPNWPDWPGDTAWPSSRRREICLERPRRAALARGSAGGHPSSLGLPEARIEIVEQSRYPVPHGALEFPRAGLVAPAAFATAGRGAVEGSGTLRPRTAASPSGRECASGARTSGW